MQVSFLSTLHAFLSLWWLTYWTFKNKSTTMQELNMNAEKLSFESSLPVRVTVLFSLKAYN